MLILGQNHPGFLQIGLNCKICSYINTRWSINASKAFKTCVRQWAKIEAHWPILILSISPLYQFHSCFSWQQKLAQHSFNIYLHIFRLKITAVTYKLTKDCSLFTFSESRWTPFYFSMKILIYVKVWRGKPLKYVTYHTNKS